MNNVLIKNAKISLLSRICWWIILYDITSG